MQTDADRLIKQIFFQQREEKMEELALLVFRFQAENNAVYRSYIRHLGINPDQINTFSQIPFLPIGFFKHHLVKSFEESPEIIFSSSGTTGDSASRHAVRDLRIYKESFLRCFELFYGNPALYRILALLPSYLEREGSSLVYMTGKLIEQSKHAESGFYLNNLRELADLLARAGKTSQPTLLIGVSFALLDLSEIHPQPLKNTIIMETGGMKGRRKELTREELHLRLKKAFSIETIHSEYGMTELLSQAYSQGEGRFRTPPWMRILIRDSHDPFSLASPGTSGGINIMDLANIYSCSFIETSDIGKMHEDGRFEILGRFDSSDVRGCNLMVE
ncbi:MAG TPA: hypothetical protein VK861_01870 [Bacteroidales bacterium]|nr:hypothetical protein [Bacteroidales bacterium]